MLTDDENKDCLITTTKSIPNMRSEMRPDEDEETYTDQLSRRQKHILIISRQETLETHSPLLLITSAGKENATLTHNILVVPFHQTVFT